MIGPNFLDVFDKAGSTYSPPTQRKTRLPTRESRAV